MLEACSESLAPAALLAHPVHGAQLAPFTSLKTPGSVLLQRVNGAWQGVVKREAKISEAWFDAAAGRRAAPDHHRPAGPAANDLLEQPHRHHEAATWFGSLPLSLPRTKSGSKDGLASNSAESVEPASSCDSLASWSPPAWRS